MHKEGMMQSFAKVDITSRPGWKVARVEKDGVYAVDKAGEEHYTPCDTVVFAMGMRANSATVDSLADSAEDVVAVGDCVRARKSCHAMLEGYWAAIDLA
jgi:NADH dehydrogenase FAD-containing subunit